MPRKNGNTTKASKRQARIDRARYGNEVNDPEAWERYARNMMATYPEYYADSWTSETAQEGPNTGD